MYTVALVGAGMMGMQQQHKQEKNNVLIKDGQGSERGKDRGRANTHLAIAI